VRNGRLQRNISALFPTGRCWLAITIPVSLYFVLLATYANQSTMFYISLRILKLYPTRNVPNVFTR